MTIGYEARCTKCREYFCPLDERDLIHIQKENGEECGGQGELTGSWS